MQLKISLALRVSLPHCLSTQAAPSVDTIRCLDGGCPEDAAHGCSRHSAAAPPAELVVVNGRLSGVRRPLIGPMTLLGRADACEIRLNVDGVHPLHAAVVYGQDGFFLRDLSGEGGVLLNDQPATLTRVGHGDVIGVGSFRFRLQLTNPSPTNSARKSSATPYASRPPRSPPSSRR